MATTETLEELQALGTRIEALQASAEALLPNANAHHTALGERAADFEEALETALTAAQESITELHAEIVALGAWRTGAVKRIADAARSVQESFDSAHAAIEVFDGALEATDARIEQLVDDSGAWFDELSADATSDMAAPVEAEQKALADDLEDLREHVRERFESDREEIGSLLSSSRDVAARLSNALVSDAATVTEQITSTLRYMSDGVQQNIGSTVSSLQGSFQRVQADAAKLNQHIVDLRTALGDITGTVSETAESTTMAMESTNIGLTTAADLFDNLRGVVKEIEELWSNS